MSKIASLRSLDVQKWATVVLLDAFGIDIDTDDGHIYFAEAPEITMDINDRVLRIELGKAIKGINYATFNPLSRVEHAQYLMTLAIYAQVIDQMMDAEEAKIADFSIETEMEMVDEFGKPVITPINVAYITRGDLKDKKGPEGVGRHIDPAIAIVYAILDWMKKTNYLPEQTYDDVIRACEEGWNEVNRIQEMTSKERRKFVKERKKSLLAPEEDDDSDDYLEGEYEARVEEDPNDIFFEDDETSQILFDETDFEDCENLNSDNDWIDSDFDESEIREIFGNRVIHHEGDEMMNDDSQPVDPQPKYVPNSEIVESIDDIDFNEHVVSDISVPQAPSPLGCDLNWMNGNMQFPNIPFEPTVVLPNVQQNVANELPDLKLEDLLTKEELEKVKEHENSEKSSARKSLDENSEIMNYSRINMNNLLFNSNFGYIP